MRFGPVPLDAAEGAILAHSVPLPTGRLRKGCILTAADIATLGAAGLDQVIVARLEPTDLHEDAAALAIAEALVPDPAVARLRPRPVGTGRVNIHATVAGIAEVLADRVNALNAVHPMITLATVPRWQRLRPEEMVATVKIIAYGVPQTAVTAACGAGASALCIRPAILNRVALIETFADPGAKEAGSDAIAARLSALGAELNHIERVAHRETELTLALRRALAADLVLILTASATSDPHDVAPQAVRLAGGEVERFGMPVDPGNLLFLGRIGTVPVIGLPGCARSPALNGADWVMERVICGVPVTGADIAGMGVGGLLKEIPIRGRLREARQE